MKLLKTLLFIGLLTVALVGGTLVFIHYYTKHNDALVQVPSVEELRIDKAIRVLEDGGFTYEISDTVFRDGVKLNSIVDQIPEAGFEVKKGRKVFLVVNASEVPDVEMPDLAGKASFSQALRILENRGLKLGKRIELQMSEIKDPDSKPVIEQRYAGKNEQIPKGTKIKRNSTVDLVVGVMIEEAVELEGEELPQTDTE
jgi:beta-lactam-binding protein with PASTA domain